MKTGFFPHFFLRFLFSLPFCFAASLAAEQAAGQGDIIQAIQRAQEQSARERAEKESGERGEAPKKFDSVPRWDAPGVPRSTAGGGPVADFFEAVVTSDLANPAIQGGQTIGRISEAVERNDAMAVAIEGADGTGKLGAIGVGTQHGALIGAPLGPVGSIIGGMVGGFLGKTVWDYTGGKYSEFSRRQHGQNLERQKKETLLSRETLDRSDAEEERRRQQARRPIDFSRDTSGQGAAKAEIENQMRQAAPLLQPPVPQGKPGISPSFLSSSAALSSDISAAVSSLSPPSSPPAPTGNANLSPELRTAIHGVSSLPSVTAVPPLHVLQSAGRTTENNGAEILLQALAREAETESAIEVTGRLEASAENEVEAERRAAIAAERRRRAAILAEQQRRAEAARQQAVRAASIVIAASIAAAASQAVVQPAYSPPPRSYSPPQQPRFAPQPTRAYAPPQAPAPSSPACAPCK